MDLTTASQNLPKCGMLKCLEIRWLAKKDEMESWTGREDRKW